MPNPKITISIDQSCVDVFNRAAAALERLCDTLEKNGGSATSSVAEPENPAEPTPVVETPVASERITQTRIPWPDVPAAPIPSTGATGFGPIGNPAPAAEPAAIPTAAPAAPAAPAAAVQMPTASVAPLSFEQIAMAGGQLMSMGINANALLTEFGVTRLSDLPPEKYPDMAARMRQLGAKI